ncbi:uncharacterized protein PRCAT00002499001 [Priceomyces carsonii]|uniref:uncharacterized protein n=1 Tax=Priceomyces carsonii TaxID=28549 RepID=UPI002ED84BDE|nr:unnamed protein product [Priceomyces carsonii]
MVLTTLSSWVTSFVPSSTELTSIDPTHSANLVASLSSAKSKFEVVTNTESLATFSAAIRGAQASLSAISYEEVIATATDDSVKASASKGLYNATVNLKELEWELNQYGMYLKMAPNALYTALFGLLFIFFLIITFWKRTWWFGIAMSCGCGLEFAGYISRALSVHDLSNNDTFLAQIICLTIAPAFIMGAIYYLLGTLIILYGPKYSKLKPLWYSIIFVFCDVVSLIVQAVGGALASSNDDNENGTHIMVAGIAFQIVSMSLFFFFWFWFLFEIYFNADRQITFSLKRLLQLFFNTKEGTILHRQLDTSYTQAYHDIRAARLFNFFPAVITSSVVFVYVRCIYRVIELAQGWRGFLITHEVYIMVLDAAMVFLACVLYVPFHPAYILGRALDSKFNLSKNTFIEFEKCDTIDSMKIEDVL